MNTINELKRLDTPFKLPQSLAWDGTHLWIGSIDTRKIYRFDPSSWTPVWETDAPGTPWGMTVTKEELRVLCGETSEDDRFLRRCIPGHGFDTAFRVPCPENTGSQLGFDGANLHLSQWYNQKVLVLGDDYQVEKSYDVPCGICGQVIVGSYIYVANTPDEETNEYYLGRIDTQTGAYEDVAKIPFPARALAHDGEAFWTNHRAANQTVRFTV